MQAIDGVWRRKDQRKIPRGLARDANFNWMVDVHDHGDDWHKYYLLQADKIFFKNENVNCGKLIVSD